MKSGSWSSFQSAAPMEARQGGEPDDQPGGEMRDLIQIGAVMLHTTGTNPYIRDELPERMGEARAKALRQWKETGSLPEGVSAWDDRNREPITDPARVDWAGLR
jgi:hypothetical protein